MDKMTTKAQALSLIKEGVSNKIISERLGVNTGTLRSWKMRYITANEQQASNAQTKPTRKPKPNATPQYNIVATQSEATAQRHIETLPQAAVLETVAKRHAPNDTPLVIAIVALHVSAIYGVGEILSSVFHTQIMGYLTATVFVCAGLIMFVSHRFSYGVSWLVLVATFLLESYCNYLTIYLNMENEKLLQFAQYTDTGVLFFCIAVFVPLVNLALEYLLFSSQQD